MSEHAHTLRLGDKADFHSLHAAMRARNDIESQYDVRIDVTPAARWDDPLDITLIRCCWQHSASAFAFSDRIVAHVAALTGKHPITDERTFGDLRKLEWSK